MKCLRAANVNLRATIRGAHTERTKVVLATPRTRLPSDPVLRGWPIVEASVAAKAAFPNRSSTIDISYTCETKITTRRNGILPSKTCFHNVPRWSRSIDVPASDDVSFNPFPSFAFFAAYLVVPHTLSFNRYRFGCVPTASVGAQINPDAATYVKSRVEPDSRTPRPGIFEKSRKHAHTITLLSGRPDHRPDSRGGLNVQRALCS